ncbi:hypothetical protein RFI_05169, partial [Reticulomyxa filosa]
KRKKKKKKKKKKNNNNNDNKKRHSHIHTQSSSSNSSSASALSSSVPSGSSASSAPSASSSSSADEEGTVNELNSPTAGPNEGTQEKTKAEKAVAPSHSKAGKNSKKTRRASRHNKDRNSDSDSYSNDGDDDSDDEKQAQHKKRKDDDKHVNGNANIGKKKDDLITQKSFPMTKAETQQQQMQMQMQVQVQQQVEQQVQQQVQAEIQAQIQELEERRDSKYFRRKSLSHSILLEQRRQSLLVSTPTETKDKDKDKDKDNDKDKDKNKEGTDIPPGTQPNEAKRISKVTEITERFEKMQLVNRQTSHSPSKRAGKDDPPLISPNDSHSNTTDFTRILFVWLCNRTKINVKTSTPAQQQQQQQSKLPSLRPKKSDNTAPSSPNAASDRPLLPMLDPYNNSNTLSQQSRSRRATRKHNGMSHCTHTHTHTHTPITCIALLDLFVFV